MVDASLNTAGCLNPRHCDVSRFLSIVSFPVHSLLPCCVGVRKDHPSIATKQLSGQTLGFRVKGLGFRVEGIGLRVQALWFRI